MSVFVALYRGINVGGKNSVKMEALRALHARLGHGDVRSYIQSGNVVFSAAGAADAILETVAAAFAREFGFAPKVMVLGHKRFRAIVEGNPYAAAAIENPKAVHAAICEGKPSARGLEELLKKTGGSEAFLVGAAVVYLHAPGGLGTSKFAAGMERAAGVPMTVRNWRSVQALADMMG